MNSRSLRGTRLGSLSMETDEGVLAAPRQEAIYDCPNEIGRASCRERV